MNLQLLQSVQPLFPILKNTIGFVGEKTFIYKIPSNLKIVCVFVDYQDDIFIRSSYEKDGVKL